MRLQTHGLMVSLDFPLSSQLGFARKPIPAIPRRVMPILLALCLLAEADEAPAADSPSDAPVVAAFETPGVVVAAHEWTDAIAADGVATELVAGPDGQPALQIIATEPATVSLLTLQPQVSTLRWAVTGQIAFDGVAPGADGEPAHVRLDSVLANRPGSYFTKSIVGGPSDPIGPLDGSSDWRPLWLPFDADTEGNTDPLVALHLRLTLPSGGTVRLSGLEVRELSADDLAAMRTHRPGATAWQTQPLTVAGVTMSAARWVGLGSAGAALIGVLIGGVVVWRGRDEE